MTHDTTHTLLSPPLPFYPALRAVLPSAGPPGTEVRLVGTAGWRIRRDCDNEDAGPNDDTCVGEVVFGDYLCNTGAGTDDASSVIDIQPNIPRYPNGNQYAVSCTLPDPSEETDSMVRGLIDSQSRVSRLASPPEKVVCKWNRSCSSHVFLIASLPKLAGRHMSCAS
jgi:hypothetical protein